MKRRRRRRSSRRRIRKKRKRRNSRKRRNKYLNMAEEHEQDILGNLMINTPSVSRAVLQTPL